MTRAEADKIICDALAKSEAERFAAGVAFPSQFLDACHCVDALLAAVAAERATRDAKWRAWVTRIETDFRGSTIDHATLLFLESYPPPDREP